MTSAILLLAIGVGLTPGGDLPSAVATTEHFTFHSDLATNLNDALLEAGRARNKQRPELFRAGPEASCFDELPASTRSAWDRAVDYYAEIISSTKWSSRPQYLIRIELSGVEPVEEPEDLRLVGIARSFMDAARPAYDACRWKNQDEANRRWIEELVAVLELHGEAVSRRLAQHYQTPLAGLPIRVDVVETVNWSGATTWLLDPAGGHILISKEDPGPASLELVFHEASHTLMARAQPVPKALAAAAKRLDVPLPGDLWHAVLFYTTGETVRRVLAEAGEPGYLPMMFAGKIFARRHEALQRTWPAYLDGERSLDEAAADLIRALDD